MKKISRIFVNASCTFILVVTAIHSYALSGLDQEERSHNVSTDEFLELHYKFNETSGSTEIIDHSGKGRTGVLSAGANITLGVQDPDFNSVLHKTGSGNIKVSGYEGIAGNEARTISFYFKQEELGFSNIFSYGNGKQGMVLINITATGRFRFVNKLGGSFLESNQAINANEWVHVAWVIQAGEANSVDAKLYLNGTLTNTTPSAGFDNVLNTVLSGNVNAVNNYNGSFYMSDLRVFSKALSNSEILIKQDQNISFSLTPGANQNLGTLKLRAKASSGLQVSYTSSNQSVATVSGNKLTIVGQGTTDITAFQLGNEYFNEAEPVVRQLRVHPPTDAGTAFDLQAFIYNKIAQGKKRIKLPEGRHRVSPGSSNAHLYFENLEGITLIGDNTELICTQTVQAIKFVNCRNFKLQDISIDYDPLPFTQGVITAISGDKSKFTVDLLDGYPTTVINSRVEIFDEETMELVTSTYYGIDFEVNTTTRQVTVTKTNYNPAFSFESIGDIAVFDSKENRKIPHGVLMDECTDMVMENVTLYAGTAFGFFERNGSNSKYIECKVIRRPIEDELVPRAFARVRSNNLDGFHSKHAEVGPTYYECVVQYNGDDGFAVNGDYHVITATNGNLLTVIGKAGRKPNILAGDSVELVSYTGERVPSAKVLSVTKGRQVNGAERAFLNAQIFRGEAVDTRYATDTYTVEIDRSIDLPLGSLIASANRIGNGAKVIGCQVGPTRSRGMVIKSSNVLISDNTVTGTWGQAIMMAPVYKWLEAGSGENIRVVDNTITHSHQASIAIYAFGGNGKTGVVGSHKNVEISDNRISNSVNPGIAVTSARGLLLYDNTISDIDNSYIMPRFEDFGNSEDPTREIYLENVELDKVVEGPLLILEEKPNIPVFVYPNPVGTHLNIRSINGIPKPYNIYDARQRLVFSSPSGKDQRIDTSNWSVGMHFLITEEQTYKIIKLK